MGIDGTSIDNNAARDLETVLVPVEGIEPTLCCQNRILSPARLPVPPHRREGFQSLSAAPVDTEDLAVGRGPAL
jgi:hypothetical protein